MFPGPLSSNAAKQLLLLLLAALLLRPRAGMYLLEYTPWKPWELNIKVEVKWPHFIPFPFTSLWLWLTSMDFFHCWVIPFLLRVSPPFDDMSAHLLDSLQPGLRSLRRGGGLRPAQLKVREGNRTWYTPRNWTNRYLKNGWALENVYSGFKYGFFYFGYLFLVSMLNFRGLNHFMHAFLRMLHLCGFFIS